MLSLNAASWSFSRTRTIPAAIQVAASKDRSSTQVGSNAVEGRASVVVFRAERARYRFRQ
jgi:hypothetical protein